MKYSQIILIAFYGLFSVSISSQNIPTDKIIANNELVNFLTPEAIKELEGGKTNSTSQLAHYFREKFSERYFYDYKTSDTRFKTYGQLYPDVKSGHIERAVDHLSKFAATAPWKLPFNYLNGEPVNAYAMRHLARQHKMVDIAFYYRYEGKKVEYLSYFKNQVRSLNTALAANKYETIEDGNGVYEAFRSGYRVLNWLHIHNQFLGESAYTDEDQLLTIATLLQHASSLYEANPEFVPGNHQTRGMSALAMLSILFRDFKDADKWNARAMGLLEQHLSKEINKDGFQFERSVHYHISDIDNYYYVYQLAKNSKIAVPPFWENKLKSLFETLTKIAYPDKSAPVFSDDTNEVWAEKNDISGALTLGYLLFNDPQMGYFANNKVASDMFWYLNNSQLKMLDQIKAKKPEFKSITFPETGYYIMREGWDKDDAVMAISNGLDPEKPDHQHGDMLGIQAMANGQIVLPNYQVRYSLKDYELFKNSMVKNVALVDNEMQGKGYEGNQGGSGFGKFKVLPQPKTITWKTNNQLDLYVGSHDGFENKGVTYSRQIIYLNHDFWIVKDNFKSINSHTYKQVWQGHYSYEKAPNLLRSSFNDGSGLDIFQLVATESVSKSGKNGKEWSVVTKQANNNFSFITALVPFKKFDDRINDENEIPALKGWEQNQSKWTSDGSQTTTLSKGDATLFFSARTLKYNTIGIFLESEGDLYISENESTFTIQSLSDAAVQMTVTTKKSKNKFVLEPGETYHFKIQ
ncbi:heparinase II/III family protein [Flavobacterium sp. F-380]|uniref:Heparinase II/III family protein n=1 Tax=Flavobacterium kayseriense TaxID=2764714 RepID=A0ABR7J519_9FLAO|nr:heparinase II/III family protein [Flavobacterium kayseriense]MBC5840644.1 heparinase II/III family protein [Flavobacterium kayseriense]MBC5846686.1 heparinase II/III family protein [Flavobacterium kayseriense]